jgi:chemosensory pili system protein ChpA (sensor histidine kinase/response regulator)
VAAASDADFDLGPLTWVKGEIDQALAKGLAALAEFAGHPDDKTPLKRAQTHPPGRRRGSGVGLDGAITLIEEVSAIWRARTLRTRPGARRGDRRRGCGTTDRGQTVTLKLYPEYEALAKLRGSESASPTDLFYPDLTRRPPHLAAGVAPLPGNRADVLLRSQRRAYQQGLLLWLRGDQQGLAAMQRAIHAIEEALAGTPTGTFWWTVGGFLASAAEQGILPSYTVKQLCARIDLQIRRFVEGSIRWPTACGVSAITSRSARRLRQVQEVQALTDCRRCCRKEPKRARSTSTVSNPCSSVRRN